MYSISIHYNTYEYVTSYLVAARCNMWGWIYPPRANEFAPTDAPLISCSISGFLSFTNPLHWKMAAETTAFTQFAGYV